MSSNKLNLISRILAMLIAVVMLFSIVPMAAIAEETGADTAASTDTETSTDADTSGDTGSDEAIAEDYDDADAIMSDDAEADEEYWDSLEKYGIQEIYYEYQGFEKNTCICDVPFSDAYFCVDPTEYNHDLCKASIGLATASMRVNQTDVEAGANVLDYMQQAGFQEITLEGYDKETSKDTVSTAIGYKIIDDFILIGVTVCSGGYKNEWLSNLTVGSGTRHEGFSYAAELVEGRVLRFIAEKHLKGTLKLWTTGFSRGAAVSNLVAGDMMALDTFADIYGYFFATPRNTRDPIAYSNLFNIIGKFDPVPMVPLAEWGYGRNGVELYIKAQQTDSDYPYYVAGAAIEYYYNAGGLELKNNPEVAQQLRDALECLVRIFPTPEEYAEKLQPLLVAAYSANASSDPIVFINAIKKLSPNGLTENEVEALEAFFDYLSGIVTMYTMGNAEQVSQGKWDTTSSFAHNLVREHESPTYLYWLTSSEDPEDIFSDNCQYVRLIIEGDVDVDIYHGETWCTHVSADNVTRQTSFDDNLLLWLKENGYLQSGSVEIDKEVLKASDAESVVFTPQLHCSHTSSRTVVDVPLDGEYSIVVTHNADGGIKYYPIICDVRNNTSEMDDYCTLYGRTGTVNNIFITRNDQQQPVVQASDVTSLVKMGSYEEALHYILKAEHLSNRYVTFGGIRVFFMALFVLLAVLLCLSIFRLIHRIVKKKPATGIVRGISIAIGYVILVAFYLIFRLLLPYNYTLQRVILIIAGVYTAVIVVNTILRNRNYRIEELQRRREATDREIKREDPGEITDSND